MIMKLQVIYSTLNNMLCSNNSSYSFVETFEIPGSFLSNSIHCLIFIGKSFGISFKLYSSKISSVFLIEFLLSYLQVKNQKQHNEFYYRKLQ